MRKLIILQLAAIFHLLAPPVLSQGVPLTGASNVIVDTENWLERNKLRSFNENEETIGERFLIENWKHGAVTTTDGITLSKVELKYDLLYDILIGRISGGAISLKKSNIETFTIENEGETLTFNTYMVDGKVLYLQVLFTGQKVSLFKKHTVKLIKKDAGNQAYGSGVAYDKYVYNEAFFVKKGEGNISPINATKRSILKELDDSSDEIKAFIKKQSINIKEDEDLTKVFEYYENIAN